MPYVTLPQRAEMPGALELAQVASDRHAAIVDAVLMESTLLDGDRSAWAPDQIAAADAARTRIETAMEEADGLIDGFLGRRYTLPLSKSPVLLVTWARAIVRYKLHGDRISTEDKDPIVRDYRDAMKLLQLIADGKFSLGVDDPGTAPGALGEIVIDPGQKVFGRKFLP